MSGRGKTPTEDALICVGKITAAHGIRGEVKIQSHLSDPQAMASLPSLTDATGSHQFSIRIRGQQKQQLIAQIDGITNRNEAELLRGTELFTAKDNLPQPDEDEFFYEELIGIEARSSEGDTLGEVVAVHNYGAGDILEIRMKASGKQEMFSFTEATVPEIDLDQGWLHLLPPEELVAKEDARDD